MSGFLAMPKLPYEKLVGPVTGLFEAPSKDPTYPKLSGLTLRQWNLLFNSWKEDFVENPSPILIQEDTLVSSTSTVIYSDPTGKFSLSFYQILEETFALLTPAVVSYEPNTENIYIFSILEADTDPTPAEKTSIKPGYWKPVLDQITKLELDRAAMKAVLYDFSKQQISVQQDFNLLDGKLNYLKTDSKASRVERLELLTKIKDIATNAHPDAMWHLFKESIELEMQKQYPIQDLVTFTIKLLETEINALKSRFKNLNMNV